MPQSATIWSKEITQHQTQSMRSKRNYQHQLGSTYISDVHKKYTKEEQINLSNENERGSHKITLVMYKWEQLIHQWKIMIWFKLKGQKGRGKPKITLVNVIRNDMLIKELMASIIWTG